MKPRIHPALFLLLLALAAAVPLHGNGDACPCCCGAAMQTTARQPNGSSVYRLPGVWQRDDGATFALSELDGHPAIVALFYTTCHVVCPVTLRILGDVDRSLPADSKVNVIVVTLDPEADTVACLASCRRENGFSRKVVLLRGSHGEVQALAAAAGIVVRREPARLIHEPKIVVLDATGHVAASFPGLQVNGAEIARAAVDGPTLHP